MHGNGSFLTRSAVALKGGGVEPPPDLSSRSDSSRPGSYVVDLPYPKSRASTNCTNNNEYRRPLATGQLSIDRIRYNPTSLVALTSKQMVRNTIALLASFTVMLGVWILYTSSPRMPELCVGIAVAILGVIGRAIVRASGFAVFRPRLLWVSLAALEPWYVVIGAGRLTINLARAILHKRSLARFHAVPFDTGGDDPESSARRTLVTAYLTIPPDSVVVGIDRKHHELLLHEIQPSSVPLTARLLGAKP